MEEEEECWACGKKTKIVYTDVLGLGWCQTCFDEIYWAPQPKND